MFEYKFNFLKTQNYRSAIKISLALFILIISLLIFTNQRGPISNSVIAKITSSAIVPRPDHIVVVMEENRAYNTIIGSPDTPYINSLASQGAILINAYAFEHPSQPDYFDLFSGSNQGVTDDSCPNTFSTPNLASELIGAGLTFSSYAEDLPSVGSTTCSNNWYTRLLNPSVDFVNVPATNNHPFTDFPADLSTLPTVSFVIPNMMNDMHTGTLSQADTWLKQNLDPYAQWAKTHNSLLIINWDEDDYDASNHIPSVFYGPMVKAGQFAVNSNSIIKTIPTYDWDAGATSNTAISSGNGNIQITVDDNSHGRMIGLNNVESSPSYVDIAYALELQSDGTLVIYEKGQWKAQPGTYKVGDILKVAVENGIVNYYKNSTLLYTSATTPIYPLFADSSIRDAFGRIISAIFCVGFNCQPVVWTNTINVTAESLHFNVLHTLEDMYNLSYAGQSSTVNPITEIWTNIVSTPTPISTSTPTPTPSPQNSCRPVSFTNIINASANGNTLQKTTSNRLWDSGATSVAKMLSGSASAQVTADSVNYGRMIGLNNVESSPSYVDIAYALELQSDGTLVVYEKGQWKAQPGTYKVGDILKVAALAGKVQYYNNGNLLYTSKTTPSYPLFLDGAIRDPKGKLYNTIFCGTY